jgi:hypothetical protein
VLLQEDPAFAAVREIGRKTCRLDADLIPANGKLRVRAMLPEAERPCRIPLRKTVGGSIQSSSAASGVHGSRVEGRMSRSSIQQGSNGRDTAWEDSDADAFSRSGSPAWFRRTALAIAVVLGTCLAFPAASPARISSPMFTVVPALPLTYAPTRLLMEGDASDSCVPKLSGVSRKGNDFVVSLYYPLELCLQVVGYWRDSVILDLLESGDYSVTVHLHRYPPTLYPTQRETFGPIPFTVQELIGATSHGLVTIRSICRNQSTGQKIVVPGPATVANCEAAGLEVASGDRVVIRTVGRVP